MYVALQNESHLGAAKTVAELIGMYTQASTAIVGYQILPDLIRPIPLGQALNTSNSIVQNNTAVPLQLLAGMLDGTTAVSA